VATANLRSKVRRLNKRLQKSFGYPPDGGHYIESDKAAQGYRLNQSVTWSLDKKLKKLFTSRSVYSHSTDPHIIAECQPTKGQKLPARTRKPKPKGEDDDPEN
jgi:hypothetical protein